MAPGGRQVVRVSIRGNLVEGRQHGLGPPVPRLGRQAAPGLRRDQRDRAPEVRFGHFAELGGRRRGEVPARLVRQAGEGVDGAEEVGLSIRPGPGRPDGVRQGGRGGVRARVDEQERGRQQRRGRRQRRGVRRRQPAGGAIEPRAQGRRQAPPPPGLERDHEGGEESELRHGRRGVEQEEVLDEVRDQRRADEVHAELLPARQTAERPEQHRRHDGPQRQVRQQPEDALGRQLFDRLVVGIVGEVEAGHGVGAAVASPRDDEVLGAPAQYGPVPERLQSRRGEGDARSAGAVRPHGQDPGRHGLGPEGPVGEGRHCGRHQNGRGHGRGQDGAGRPPGGRHPAPRPVGREDQTRGPQTDHGAAGARQPERPEVDEDHRPPQAPDPGEAGGPPAERLDDERRADHRVDHRVRAQETRVAERGAHSVARVAEQVDVDEVVVMRQTRRAHHGTHREVDAEEQPPVGGAPEHGTGHEREQEPVGEIEHALHAIVGGPQASGGTDAERPRGGGHEQPDGERERRPRPARTAPAVEERQRDPDGRRDLDDRAGVNGLADDEG